jgi:hypothetical protein
MFLPVSCGLAEPRGPQLTDRGPVRYTGYDADPGIEPGMMVWVGRLRYHGTVLTGRRS